MRVLLSSLAVAVALACSPSTAAPPPSAAPSSTTSPAPAKTEAKKPVAVGEAAPDFTLKDLDGKDVSLSSFKGKTVVLEWFNPECPFVVKSHTRGSLVTTAKKHTDNGVVWLAVNSGAPGKQGHDPQKNAEMKKAWNIAHPILRDESGTVGKAYGATNTPHMFVIDKAGVVVYAGAIDNSPDGEGQSPTSGTLVNHVDAALAALSAGKPVPQPATTKAYGCGVKYGS